MHVGTPGSRGRTWSTEAALSSDKDAPTGDQASVRPFQARRYRQRSVRVRAEAVKKPAKRLFWRQGRLARVEPTQVHIQLAVFKPPGDTMGEADSRHGVPNPGCSVDAPPSSLRCRPSRRPGLSVCSSSPLAAGRSSHVEGQLRWYRPDCAGPGSSLDVAGDARGVPACITASTSSADTPTAAATNKARAGSARFRASASNSAVSLRAVRLMPAPDH